jgi:membrane protein YdbS with pleckstrin-like domain
MDSGIKAAGPPPRAGEAGLTGIERWLLTELAVPAQPDPPEGSPDSIQIFRAGRNYYVWSVLAWCAKSLLVVVALAVATVAIAMGTREAADWLRPILAAVATLVWLATLAALAITFLSLRLTYLLRWYIVTDRSLRIRRGIFAVDELTMTYSNIQEVRVTSGPLQLLLGLADVEVQAAGGGSNERGRRTGHVGRLEGLSNANEIRDLLMDRLRRYRDAGLGDTPHQIAGDADTSALAAARTVLNETRALRAALASLKPEA